MRNQMMLASVTDWCTKAWAAEHIGVSQRHVGWLIATGRLAKHRPRVGSQESGRSHVLLNVEEVQRYAQARNVVHGA